MSAHNTANTARRSRVTLALAAVGVFALTAIIVYLVMSVSDTRAQRAAGAAQTARVAEASADAVPGQASRAIPELRFQDGNGKPRALSEFRGKVVLLNIWATWCVPCREEMPALDHVQQKLGGPTFENIALSIDRGGVAAVRRFYDEIGIGALAIYVDPESQVIGKLRTVGVPTTLLIDREGREQWRKTGPAKWDEAEMVAKIRAHIDAVSSKGR